MKNLLNHFHWSFLIIVSASCVLGGCSSGASDPTNDDPEPSLGIEPTDSGMPPTLDSQLPAPDTIPGADQGEHNQRLLRELLPDYDVLFGQPIDDIPLPIIEQDSTQLYWSYDIVNDQLSNDHYEAPLSHQLTWERYANLIPLQYRASLKQVGFLVAGGGEGLCSTGLAGVSSQGFDGVVPGKEHSTLIICERLAGIYFESYEDSSLDLGDFTRSTIWIHETGHIIEAMYTVDLKVPHGDYYDTGLSQASFSTGLHTPVSSLIGQYFQTFWLGEIQEYYIANRYQDNVGSSVFNEYPDSFVSQYAATNFGEDFAETFTEFIMLAEHPAPDGKMKTDKIRWFWSLPRMVTMCDDILSRI